MIITPDYLHLGDLINITHSNIGSTIGINPCVMQSGKSVFDTLAEIFYISGFSLDKLVPESGFLVQQNWGIKYAKSPISCRKKFIFSYCFGTRSLGPNMTSKLPERELIDDFLRFPFGLKKVDVDGNLSLIEKYKILASSLFYVGADNGISHLALLTDTPIVIWHSKSFDAKKFYYDCDQISFKTELADLIEFCLKKTPRIF